MNEGGADAVEDATSGASPGARPRTVRLDVEYDGSDFAGWQLQPGLRTVQGALEEAARQVLADAGVCVVGAGRTDSGTHAVGQVAHLRTASRLALDRLRAGLNTLLPRDVRVRGVVEAEAGFHARFSAAAKEYRYHFWQDEVVPPFLRRYCWGVRRPLDVAAMARAAQLFEGTQDLSSFRASGCTARTPERTVHSSRMGERGALVVYAISARGFLQHMVRIIAATLAAVGRGRLGVDDVADLVRARDRSRAPATAPAHGLFLVRVIYPGENAPLDARADPVLAFLDLRR